MKGIITVVLKQDILDPQGRAVMNSLQGLGYDEVQGVRIGKSIEIELNGISPCLLYTSPSPRDGLLSRMPSSA